DFARQMPERTRYRNIASFRVARRADWTGKTRAQGTGSARQMWTAPSWPVAIRLKPSEEKTRSLIWTDDAFNSSTDSRAIGSHRVMVPFTPAAASTLPSGL